MTTGVNPAYAALGVLTTGTGSPVIHGRVFLIPCATDQCTFVHCTVLYNGHVTLYKVPEKHSHVYLCRVLKIYLCQEIRIHGLFGPPGPDPDLKEKEKKKKCIL